MITAYVQTLTALFLFQLCVFSLPVRRALYWFNAAFTRWQMYSETCTTCSCKRTGDVYAHLLSAQCISSIGQVMKSVCVPVSEWVSLSHKTSWTLYRSQSSTDLHQTCHQRRVAGDVVTYCFWWKSEIFLSAKPEVELILTIAPMGKISLMSNISKTVRDTMLDSKEVG